MKQSNIYQVSFYIGAVIQIILIPGLFVSFHATLVLMFANMIASLLFYPVLLTYFIQNDHFAIPPGLGPHH